MTCTVSFLFGCSLPLKSQKGEREEEEEKTLSFSPSLSLTFAPSPLLSFMLSVVKKKKRTSCRCSLKSARLKTWTWRPLCPCQSKSQIVIFQYLTKQWNINHMINIIKVWPWASKKRKKIAFVFLKIVRPSAKQPYVMSQREHFPSWRTTPWKRCCLICLWFPSSKHGTR